MEQQRAETGVLEFEGDWPGVFIRGDNAFAFVMALRVVLKNSSADPMSKIIVQGLLDLLENSDVRNNPPSQKAKWCPIE
jgi:hypothetical protein